MLIKQFKCYLGILLLGVPLLFSNCQKDDALINNEKAEKPNSGFKIQKIKASEIQKNTNVFSKINIIRDYISKNTSDNQNKTVYSQVYDFEINTEQATYIENLDQSYHSYTFPIHRSVDNGPLENLILSLQDDGSYKSYINTYHITTQEVNDLKQGVYVDIGDRFTMVEIEDVDLTGTIFNKVIYVDCVVGTTISWTCENGIAGHKAGNPGPPACQAAEFYYVIQTHWGTCAVDDGISEDTGTTGDQSTGGGGNSSPPNDTEGETDPTDLNNHNGETVVSVPTVEDSNEGLQDPCQEILDQMADSNYIQQVHNELNNQAAFTAHVEKGFAEYASPNERFQELSLLPNGFSLEIPSIPSTIGTAHVHNDDFYTPHPNNPNLLDIKEFIRMPSPADIVKFLLHIKYANLKGRPLIGSYLNLYSSDGIYALRFTGNYNDVSLKYHDLRAKAFEKKLDKYYKIYFSNYPDKEKAFLLFLRNEINIGGIRLFKINNENTIEEKTLNDNAEVVTTPC